MFGFRPTETCHTDNHNLIQLVASVTTVCSSFYRPMSQHDSWVLISDLFQCLVLLFFSLQVCICTGKFLCHCDGVKGQKVRIRDDVTTGRESNLFLSQNYYDRHMYVRHIAFINIFCKNEIVWDFFNVFRTSFVLWNHFKAWSVLQWGHRVKIRCVTSDDGSLVRFTLPWWAAVITERAVVR